MRISSVLPKEGVPVNFIEVRNYPNSVVNIPNGFNPKKTDFVVGAWNVRYKSEIPIEYLELSKKI